MSLFAIELVQQSDLSAINRLMQATFKVHASLYPQLYQEKTPEMIGVKGLAKIISDPEQTIFVARQKSDEQVMGFILLCIQNDEEDDVSKSLRKVSVEEVGVFDDHQGQGIGTALVREAEEWAKQQGASEITGWTYADNKSSRRLFQKNDYQEFTVRFSKRIKAES